MSTCPPFAARAVLLALFLALSVRGAERVVLSLDGEWRIDEGVSRDASPSTFGHTVRVPGLVNQSRPEFVDVDQFQSREWIDRQTRAGELPITARILEVGRTRQKRNFFWYTRTFRAPAPRQVAILKVNKAQFGIEVWLNGQRIGEHMFCFTAGYFDVSKAIRWDAENTLTIRVGAHPGMIPAEIPAGTDFEKLKWTPGIYDSVTLHTSDNPIVESIQVAPQIEKSAVLVETVVRNYGAAGDFRLRHEIHTWKDGALAGQGEPLSLRLGAGESKTVTQTIRIPGAHLWKPEDPFLYELRSTTDGDTLSTRFGMREFRFDTATRRAYLNGRVYFLRGSNITLHRFFEDPKAGSLPWDEQWVRKLLIEIPKRMNWNSFRFCIGPVPELWFHIADEAGLLIQNEFFIWTGGEGWNSWHHEWSAALLIEQYKQWMRDHWNHPSQAIWDASNETAGDLIAREVIPKVRRLDLSSRPWENGYTLPTGPHDPVEDHPYLFSRNWNSDQPGFDMAELERMTGAKSANSAHPTGHAAFINEYGWLWVNRDGTPTELTKKVYGRLLGKDATPQQRLELNAYLLAGLTEFWRAHRNFAGVLHFVYLTCSYPGVYTSDHFRDVENLELHAPFADYMREAFKPLGVYVNFFQPKADAGASHHLAVMLVNDEDGAMEGELVLSFERPGRSPVVAARSPFSLPPLGQQSYRLEVRFPDAPGDYLLKATAVPSSPAGKEPTVCRRKVRIQPAP